MSTNAPERSPLVSGTVIAMAGLVLSGSIRFAFNAVGLRTLGPEYLGVVNPTWSGFILAATLLSAPASLVLGRLSAAHLGEGRDERARSVLSAVLLVLVPAGILTSILADRFFGQPSSPGLAWLVLLSALQLALRSAYYAFRRHALYFVAELLAALVFFAVFLPASALQSRAAAGASIVIYPAAFCAIALWHLRDVISLRPRRIPWRETLGGLGPLVLDSLVLSLHGLGAFHGILLLGGLLLEPVMVGYLSVIIAALAPLHLLPAALNTTLFPEIARRMAAADESASADMVAKSVLVLCLATVPAGVVLLVFSESALRVLAVPASGGPLQTWLWMGLASLLAVISAPAGSYLNATHHIRLHTVLSGLSLLLGLGVGLLTMGAWGIVGAGYMRFGVVGLLALVRLAIVQWQTSCLTPVRAPLLAGLGILVGAFATMAGPTRPPGPAWTWPFMALALVFVFAGARMLSMKELLRNLPIVGRLGRRWYRALRPFPGSDTFWERRYAAGGDSGVGSSGKFAEFKAEVINGFVREQRVETIIEYGCGDGTQLQLADYPEYLGFDVSPTAVARCQRIFASDPTKAFKLMGEYAGERADLTLSLDVIYHLVEEPVFTAYLERLFGSAERFVIVYSSNSDDNSGHSGAYVRHRKFTDRVDRAIEGWKLIERIPNRYPYRGDYREGSWADFYVFRRL